MMVSNKSVIIFFILGIITATFLIGEYFTPSTEINDPKYYQVSNVTFENNKYFYLLFDGENYRGGASDYAVNNGDILSAHTFKDTLHIPVLYEGRSWDIIGLNGDIVENYEIKYYSITLILIYIATFIIYGYPHIKGRRENIKAKP